MNAAARPRRGRLRRVAGALLPGLGLATVAWAAFQGSGEWEPTRAPARVDWLLAAAGVAILARLAFALLFGVVLRSTRTAVALGRAARVWLVAEAARWWPGAVWGYAARTTLGVRAGLPARGIALAMGVELVLTIAGWASAASLAYLLAGELSPELLELERHASLPGALALLLALGLAGLLAWHAFPSTRSRALSRLAPLARARPRWAHAAGALALYALTSVLTGLGFHLCLLAAGAAPPSIWHSTAAASMAWLIGFFSFFAPGGLGVREAAAVWLLAGWVPAEGAAAGALLWRLAQIAVELAVLCALWLRSLVLGIARPERALPEIADLEPDPGA